MHIKDLRISQNVRHPKFDGTGDVTRIEPDKVEVFFNHGKTVLSLEEVGELIPTDSVDTRYIAISAIIEKAVDMVLEKRQETPVKLANKWIGGKIVISPKDMTLAPKEVELDTFFHKIVMVRDNLRVLEQKVNSHKVLTEAEKVELQQYITRMAGSLTTFNVLFKDKDDQF